MTNRESERQRIPVPDPFGILESLTNGTFYDPVRAMMSQPVFGREEEKAIGPPPDLLPEEERIDRYIKLLEQAYQVAPCKGCQALVESAITGAEVYREMEQAGMTAEQVRGDEEFMKSVREMVSKRLGGSPWQ